MKSLLFCPLSSVFSRDDVEERRRVESDRGNGSSEVSLLECFFRNRNLVPGYCDGLNLDVSVTVLLALWIIFSARHDDDDGGDGLFSFKRRGDDGPGDGDGEEYEMPAREPISRRDRADRRGIDVRDKMTTPVSTETVLHRLPHFPIVCNRVRRVFLHSNTAAENTSKFSRNSLCRRL